MNSQLEVLLQGRAEASSVPAAHLDSLQAACNLPLDEGGHQVAAALHRWQRHLLWQGRESRGGE